LTVLAVGAAVYVGNQLGAQTGATGAPAATQTRSRIALVNLSHVIKNYDKFKGYMEEMKTASKPFRDREEKIKKDAEVLVNESKAPTVTAERKETIEKNLKTLKRAYEDLSNEAGVFMGKKQEQQFVIVYGDVRNAAERYAVAHAYDMVLHYNDAVNPQEYWSGQNVARKIQAGALIPLYYAGGVDISAEIIKMLNDSAKRGPAPAAAATRPGG
jgi:Skp family chaperone for outer membrane proteins